MSKLAYFDLPDVGEGLTEAEIVSWKVKPGDTVSVNQIIVEIETAKSLVELPCPFAGVVTQLLANEGDTVNVGAHIIEVEVSQLTAAAAGSMHEAIGEAAAAVADVASTATIEEKPQPTLVGYGVSAAGASRRKRAGVIPVPAVVVNAAPASSTTSEGIPRLIVVMAKRAPLAIASFAKEFPSTRSPGSATKNVPGSTFRESITGTSVMTSAGSIPTICAPIISAISPIVKGIMTTPLSRVPVQCDRQRDI